MMSNAKGRADGHYSAADFQKEAAGEPFVMDVDLDHSIEIIQPDMGQMFDAEDAMRLGSSREVIRAICGDQADEVLKVVSKWHPNDVRRFNDALAKHFGLGESGN